MPRHDDPDLFRPDVASGGLDALDRAVPLPDAGDLAVLDDVDTAGIRTPGKPPGDGVVARDPPRRWSDAPSTG